MASHDPLYHNPKFRPTLNCLLLLLSLLGTNLITLYLSLSWQSSPLPHAQLHLDPSHFSDLALSLSSQLNLTQSKLRDTLQELADVKSELQDFREMSRSFLAGVQPQDNSSSDASDPWLRWESEMKDQSMGKELQEFISVRNLPLGWSLALASRTMVSPVGHACALQQEDVKKYMDYEVGGECPDDQGLAQQLTVRGCEPLPRRRCFARTPPDYREPYPIPDCFWTIPPDESILWTPYTCKSFGCLNDRKKQKIFEDCIDCFELHGREKHRWATHRGDLDFSIDEVLELKKGTIRIGLDIGAGSGTFAVRMREKNVTMVATTLNLNGPFNNFIALRGVVPLFLTIAQRLPFFDNTLDIVHSMHVLSNWMPTETLEFLLFDIDRILRPGGLFWLDHFFCLRPQLEEIYVPLIDRLGYNKLKWAIGPKLDRGPEVQEMYMSAVLEKPISSSRGT